MSRRTGLVTVGGSVLAALIASACCWLPLLLVTFGVSAAGVSAQFESVRPYFLALTAVLLGAGFYFSYFRRRMRRALWLYGRVYRWLDRRHWARIFGRANP